MMQRQATVGRALADATARCAVGIRKRPSSREPLGPLDTKVLQRNVGSDKFARRFISAGTSSTASYGRGSVAIFE